MNVEGILSNSPKATASEADNGAAADLFKVATRQGTSEPKPPPSGSGRPDLQIRQYAPSVYWPGQIIGPSDPGSGVGGPSNSDAPNNSNGDTTPPPTGEVTDTYVKDWLDSLGDAINPQDKAQLAQVGDDATTLLAFFRAYPENSSHLNADVPPAVAAAESRLLDIAAVKQQLVDPASGEVTRFTVSAFLTNLDNAAISAKSDWASFQKSDPNADPTVTQFAVDASILQANSPILDEAGPGSRLDGEISAQDLQAVGHAQAPGATESQVEYDVELNTHHQELPYGVAPPPIPKDTSPVADSSGGNDGDATLPSALKHAAALFSSSGMFDELDQAGDNPTTTKPDGLMDANNLGKFVSDEASTMTPEMLMGIVSEAADQNMTTGIDISKLGPDVFKNPQNYSGAQKSAVLMQLEKLQAMVEAGVNTGEWTPIEFGSIGQYKDMGVDPNDVLPDLKAKIDQLSNDQSVEEFIGNNSAKFMQAITSADPLLQSAMKSHLATFENGDALKAALGAHDSNGQPVTAEQGLASFIDQVTTWAQAVGPNGQPAPIDLRRAAQNSGENDKLEAAFKADILSGNEVKTALANGVPLGQAVQQFMSDAANFSAVLPSDFIKQNTAALQNAFSTTISDSLLGSTTQGDLNAEFADKNGNLDTAKLTTILQLIEKQDPDAFKDSAGVPIPPDKIISAFKYVWDNFRQFGGKLPDALYKGQSASWGERNPEIGPNTNPTTDPKPGKPTGALADAYNSGMMHIVSALFGTAALVAKGVEGGSPGTVAASSVAGAFQITGGLMEGAAKFAKDPVANYWKANPPPADTKPGWPRGWVPSAAQLKSIENWGKALGGYASILAGAVSIFGGVQALQHGDKLDGGVGIGTGILQTMSGTSSAIEGMATLADAGDSALAALGVTSSILGGASAVVGTFAIVALSVVEVVKALDAHEAFNDQIIPGIEQWQIGVDGQGGSNIPPPTPSINI